MPKPTSEQPGLNRKFLPQNALANIKLEVTRLRGESLPIEVIDEAVGEPMFGSITPSAGGMGGSTQKKNAMGPPGKPQPVKAGHAQNIAVGSTTRLKKVGGVTRVQIVKGHRRANKGTV